MLTRMTTLASSISERYIGLMSGTSLDGVDGVLVDFSGPRPMLLTDAYVPFPPALRQAFFDLQSAGHNEIHREALAANALADLYAECVAQLLHESGCDPREVRAIGAHGQTIRHQPGEHDGIGYTRQTQHAAVLAERTGIDVIADFRSRDIAAGGQGAPLVPAVHRALFALPDAWRVICNIGGIANLT
ncbi:anhydro-N-acetylmuramic acid kinase, partial [Ralstonia pseudosolanacearum]